MNLMVKPLVALARPFQLIVPGGDRSRVGRMLMFSAAYCLGQSSKLTRLEGEKQEAKFVRRCKGPRP